ncbi:hypothetical protein ACFPA8_27605 [Streptomyces ovatisporus]|uniref:Integral membrane protein n=1 Tax=Streptomyces ovatisporus TaxID=1128682 RepID=A0ABV9ADV7_9ACTN
MKHGKIRDLAGRAGTITGAAALAAAMVTPTSLVLTLPAASVAAWGAFKTFRARFPAALLPLPVVNALPSCAVAVGSLAYQCSPGIRWWELLATAAWVAVTWGGRPSRLMGRIAEADRQNRKDDANPGAALQVRPLGPLATREERTTASWAANIGCEGGAVPGTHLENAVFLGEQAFRAEVVANEAGTPVGEVSVERLSALTDIPADLIKVGPVPGRGAGRKLLEISEEESAASGPADIHEFWAKYGTKAMPGTRVISAQTGIAQWREQA